MEIKKLNEGFEVIFETAKILFDIASLKEAPLILTDKERNLNEDRIFNSPGEYNVGEVYFWGLDNKDSLAFLFEENGYSLIYFKKDLDENVKKQIKFLKREIEIIFSPEISNLGLVKELKSKMLITSKNVSLQGFSQEKGEKIKFNPQKVENLIFILK